MVVHSFDFKPEVSAIDNIKYGLLSAFAKLIKSGIRDEDVKMRIAGVLYKLKNFEMPAKPEAERKKTHKSATAWKLYSYISSKRGELVYLYESKTGEIETGEIDHVYGGDAGSEPKQTTDEAWNEEFILAFNKFLVLSDIFKTIGKGILFTLIQTEGVHGLAVKQFEEYAEFFDQLAFIYARADTKDIHHKKKGAYTYDMATDEALRTLGWGEDVDDEV